MSARQQWIWIAALGIHVSLVMAVSLNDMSSTLADAPNLLPAFFKPLLDGTAASASMAMGGRLDETNPLRQMIATYADCAGIEAGYSYFAPGVPGNSKLVFELHYPDGRVEYDVPTVGGAAAGYRVSTMLDRLQAVRSRRLRDALLKDLVYSIRREHPTAMRIRVVFGVANLINLADYRVGKRISYQPSYAYDFRFRPP